MFSQNIFERYHAKIIITTEDGSYGFKGLVSDPLEEILKLKIDRAYVCGPTPMLKAVIPLIKKANIKGEVSIEEKMGCGYGVCLSCVVPILKNGEIERQRVCVEGPVFRLEEIVLDVEP
jgi:dihydroorotate dehydrogenase electron transfer subunit